MTGVAVRAGGFFAPGPRAPRIAALAGVAAAHLAALLLLPGAPSHGSDEAEATLAVFDVAPPPLPALPPEPEPEPRAARPQAATSGGSPGQQRERAAPMVDRPRPPERSAMDATIATDAPALAAPAIDAGTAALDLGSGGVDGVGSGSGSGTGDGSASGSGRAVYSRVEWVEKPTDARWRRVWPRRATGTALKGPVSVLLGCYVRTSGHPHRCKVLRTAPDRPSFGRAALALVADARVRPVRRNGQDIRNLPVGIPILFDEKAVTPADTASPSAVAADPSVSAEASALPVR